MNENIEYSLAREMLQDYKAQNERLFILNKRLFVVIGLLLTIICLFVGGLVYIFSTYDVDFQFVGTEKGNACVGDNCGNGDVDARSN